MAFTQDECDAFWNNADKNGDGELTIQELAAALKEFRSPGGAPTDRDIAFMFNSLDKSGDSKVSRDEFMQEMLKPPRSQTLRETFQLYDKDGSGYLSRDEVRDVIKASNCFGSEGFEDAVDEIFAEADPNNDGKVTLDEFMKACS
ncbi:calmodulin-A-like [Dreissena polymorpha]|uniref:EF-hand domain-containing protein n=1 Tax=Dreissena polymorpha TaxID=45954 RepID=A0A9D4CDA1_DREPO|nr:calmodulin-A-like [Dreissena polymorpha]XP_052246143.1 calmodulin-A-like [Dreissena polymorpha]KAH3721552.1 hypothetical protein DPMN_064481 [Dreissena polymorpha]KAH3721585.1 hypothetical protein DPMN_064514 [Dreissena polymorpha]